ncbi:hypothetical protein [Pseudomonas phage PIP]|nr:hypothetical protein [Pseudomonas phage PIP]
MDVLLVVPKAVSFPSAFIGHIGSALAASSPLWSYRNGGGHHNFFHLISPGLDGMRARWCLSACAV